MNLWPRCCRFCAPEDIRADASAKEIMPPHSSIGRVFFSVLLPSKSVGSVGLQDSCALALLFFPNPLLDYTEYAISLFEALKLILYALELCRSYLPSFSEREKKSKRARGQERWKGDLSSLFVFFHQGSSEPAQKPALPNSIMHCTARYSRPPATMDVSAGALVFIKLGGSLISDKTNPETLRGGVLDRIARCGA